MTLTDNTKPIVDDLCVKELKGRLKIEAYIHCAQRTMVLHLRLSQAIYIDTSMLDIFYSPLPYSIYICRMTLSSFPSYRPC